MAYFSVFSVMLLINFHVSRIQFVHTWYAEMFFYGLPITFHQNAISLAQQLWYTHF